MCRAQVAVLAVGASVADAMSALVCGKEKKRKEKKKKRRPNSRGGGTGWESCQEIEINVDRVRAWCRAGKIEKGEIIGGNARGTAAKSKPKSRKRPGRQSHGTDRQRASSRRGRRRQSDARSPAAPDLEIVSDGIRCPKKLNK